MSSIYGGFPPPLSYQNFLFQQPPPKLSTAPNAPATLQNIPQVPLEIYTNTPDIADEVILFGIPAIASQGQILQQLGALTDSVNLLSDNQARYESFYYLFWLTSLPTALIQNLSFVRSVVKSLLFSNIIQIRFRS